MKKITFLTAFCAVLTLSALDIVYILSSNSFFTELKASSSNPNSSSSSNPDPESSSSSSTSTSSSSSGNPERFIPYYDLRSRARITHLDVKLSGKFQVGQIISKDLAANLKLQYDVEYEDYDEYKRTCFEGGSCVCQEIGWTHCSSQGCPKTGEEKGCKKK